MKDLISVLLANCRLGFIVFSLFGIAAASVGAAQTSISACPYNITAPGNYVVARNLAASGTCISFSVPVSNIILDLQGHSITGNGTGYGIVCLPNANDRCDHVIIANGTVASFSGGIALYGNFNTIFQVTSKDNVATNINSGTGMLLSGDWGNLVIESLSTGNAEIGIASAGGGFSTLVSGSRADNNGLDGIRGTGMVSDSEADNNAGRGISAPIVTESTARRNALEGIFADNTNYTSVVNSTSSDNTGDGIFSAGAVINSTANNNAGRGIVLFTCPVSVVGNTAINNPGGNIVPPDVTCLLLNNKTAP
jgi:hypothetical protein